MKKTILHCFLLLYFMVVVFLGCAIATDSSVKNSPNPQEATAITGIDIQDNAVAITVNKPFIYTIYKPGDPYKIIIDLPNVAIGTFNQKIVSHKSGYNRDSSFPIEFTIYGKTRDITSDPINS